MNADQKLEPGVYEVIKPFHYCELNIDLGEILEVYISGAYRVHGGLWYGFKRDKEFCNWFNSPFRRFMNQPREYNSKYIPLDCIQKKVV